MTIEALGTLIENVKLQYLRILLLGEVLHELETLCGQNGNTTMMNLNHVLLGLGMYYPL